MRLKTSKKLNRISSRKNRRILSRKNRRILSRKNRRISSRKNKRILRSSRKRRILSRKNRKINIKNKKKIFKTKGGVTNTSQNNKNFWREAMKHDTELSNAALVEKKISELIDFIFTEKQCGGTFLYGHINRENCAMAALKHHHHKYLDKKIYTEKEDEIKQKILERIGTPKTIVHSTSIEQRISEFVDFIFNNETCDKTSINIGREQHIINCLLKTALNNYKNYFSNEDFKEKSNIIKQKIYERIAELKVPNPDFKIGNQHLFTFFSNEEENLELYQIRGMGYYASIGINKVIFDFIEYYHRINNLNKMLEIGCGSGLWSKLLKNRGIDITPTDACELEIEGRPKPEKRMADWAKKRAIEIECMDAVEAVKKYGNDENSSLLFSFPLFEQDLENPNDELENPYDELAVKEFKGKIIFLVCNYGMEIKKNGSYYSNAFPDQSTGSRKLHEYLGTEWFILDRLLLENDRNLLYTYLLCLIKQ